MNYLSTILSLIILTVISSCNESNKKPGLVEVRKENGSYVLYRNGKPYFIRGAAGFQHLNKIKEHGGNSIRIWSCKDADNILDEAHKNGLTVILGLDVLSERHGFDYNNEDSVKAQFERLKKVVVKHKDHPALLMWGIGNELDLFNAKSKAKNLKVWDAVEEIAEMIHNEDPNHPTTTMVVPFRTTVWNIKNKCPSIDILSINTFGALKTLPEKLREPIWGWNGPYIISEWGSQGWWEVEKTLWEAPLELSSTQKAEMYKERYTTCIQKDPKKCLGSYVFYWGQKQEKTSTWFSLFTKNGEETETVGVMNNFWTGKVPKNKAPKILSMLNKNIIGKDNIFLNAGELSEALVKFEEPDGDSVSIRWEIYNDTFENKGGGDFEFDPSDLSDRIVSKNDNKVIFKSPLKEGPYRLFVYVIDPNNKVGTANIPFFVIEK